MVWEKNNGIVGTTYKKIGKSRLPIKILEKNCLSNRTYVRTSIKILISQTMIILLKAKCISIKCPIAPTPADAMSCGSRKKFNAAEIINRPIEILIKFNNFFMAITFFSIVEHIVPSWSEEIESYFSVRYEIFVAIKIVKFLFWTQWSTTCAMIVTNLESLNLTVFI